MLKRSITHHAGALIALAVLSLTLAGTAHGQAVPPKKPVADSLKKAPALPAAHIKIRKDSIPGERQTKTVVQSGGEVCIPLTCVVGQDSVDRAVAAVREGQFAREQFARDALRRLDSMETARRVRVAVARLRGTIAATRERARLDSVARAEAAAREAQLAQKQLLARGFYVGIGGGASTPQRDTRNGYTGGWNTTVPFGWDASESPVGIRANFAVDHLNGTRFQDQNAVTTAASGDITIWSLDTDLKLRAHAPGAPSRTNVYALGGVGLHRVTEGVYGTTGPSAGQNLTFGNAKTAFGWNVGAGASIAWGPTELFVESRFIQIKSDLGYHMNGGVGTYTAFTPIVVGLQWF
jgi:opacity protein-like surface antigen